MRSNWYYNFGQVEQGAEDKAGRTGNCPEEKDKDYHIHIGEQEQQTGLATGKPPESTVITAAIVDCCDRATLGQQVAHNGGRYCRK
jgi:hypothetical protein